MCVWSDTKHEWVFLPSYGVNQSTWPVRFFREARASAQWRSVTDVVLQARAEQTAGSALQRSAPDTCVCDGAHHWLYYPSAGQGWEEYVWLRVWACLRVSVFVCLWWEGVGGVETPLFYPLISKQEKKMLKERARKETVRRQNKGRQGMRKDLVFQIQLLRSQGYSAPLPPPIPPQAMFSSPLWL